MSDFFLVSRQVCSRDRELLDAFPVLEGSDLSNSFNVRVVTCKVFANSWILTDLETYLRLHLMSSQHLKWNGFVEDVVTRLVNFF